MNKPHLYPAIILSSIATVLWVLAFGLSISAGLLIPICGVLAVVLTYYSMLYLWDWIAQVRHIRKVRLIEAENRTDEVLICEAVARMDEGQLDTMRNSPHLSPIISGVKPRYASVFGVQMEWLWLAEFTSDEEWLRPIGDYSEGTKGRRWAEYLTRPHTGVWVVRGWVVPSAGSWQARWKNKAAAMASVKMMGVEG